MARHAFTLVEMLAVTVLLGLLASLGVPPLLRTITGDPLGRAADRLNLAFRDARAQAHGHRLGLDLDTSGFTATTEEDGQLVELPTTRVPETIQLTWTRNGRSVRRLDLDPRGHGLDTDVTLRFDERELHFTIDGLTGAWMPRSAP